MNVTIHTTSSVFPKTKHTLSPVSPLPEFPHSTVFPTSKPSLSAAEAGNRCGLSSLSEERESDTCAAGMARDKSATQDTGAEWEEGENRGPPDEGSKGSGHSWNSPLSVR